MRNLILLFSILVLLLPFKALAEDTCEGNFDCDQDVDGTDAAVFKEDFGRSQSSNPCETCNDSPCPCTLCPDGLLYCGSNCVDPNTDEEYCGSCDNPCGIGEMCVEGTCEIGGAIIFRSSLPKTGQTTSYATGDDGDLEKGVAWAKPRFTDNGDGTVTDNLTGLIWLKNANCFGPRLWNTALSDCNGLSDGLCGLTDGSSAGDWRLPNRFELESLLDLEYYLPALSNTDGTGQWSEGDPFTNVKYEYNYWSSTAAPDVGSVAWYVNMEYAEVFGCSKTYCHFYVWPVRGGH